MLGKLMRLPFRQRYPSQFIQSSALVHPDHLINRLCDRTDFIHRHPLQRKSYEARFFGENGSDLCAYIY